MPEYTIALKSRRRVASKTMAFLLEKPDGFDFKAGQCADWTLLSPPETDDEGDTRTFTIASAPFEPDLMFTTRLRDTAFKRDIEEIPLGAKFKITDAGGDLVLHEDATVPAVFIAGGIGVTPVRSIVLQAVHDNLPHRITVVTSDRHPADAPFLDEFLSIQASRPNFKLVETITEPDGSIKDWRGETGHIDVAMLQRHIADLKAPIYYVSGPPEMVTGMRQLLENAGVDGSKVIYEDFEGY